MSRHRRCHAYRLRTQRQLARLRQDLKGLTASEARHVATIAGSACHNRPASAQPASQPSWPLSQKRPLRVVDALLRSGGQVYDPAVHGLPTSPGPVSGADAEDLVAAQDAAAAAAAEGAAAEGDRAAVTSCEARDGMGRPNDGGGHGSATAEKASHATRAIANAFDRSLTPARAWVP
jgi:hypothetical protein